MASFGILAWGDPESDHLQPPAGMDGTCELWKTCEDVPANRQPEWDPDDLSPDLALAIPFCSSDMADLLSHAWAFLIENIDLVEWVACLVLGNAAALTLVANVLGRAVVVTCTEIDIKEDPAAYVVYPGVILVCAQNWLWERLLKLWKCGSTSQRTTAVIEAASILLHETVHASLLSLFDMNWKEADEDDVGFCSRSGAYRIENSFTWAARQRYPNSCGYVGDGTFNWPKGADNLRDGPNEEGENCGTPDCDVDVHWYNDGWGNAWERVVGAATEIFDDVADEARETYNDALDALDSLAGLFGGSGSSGGDDLNAGGPSMLCTLCPPLCQPAKSDIALISCLDSIAGYMKANVLPDPTQKLGDVPGQPDTGSEPDDRL